MKKRILAIVLTLCLVLSLAACSSGKNDDSSQTQEPSSAESSEPEKESSSPEENSSEKGPAEEEVSEAVLDHYGLSAEEFAALKTSIQAHIDSEWDAEEAYLTLDNGGIYDLAYICTIIRDEAEDRGAMDGSEDLRDDIAMDAYIGGEIEKAFSSDGTSSLSDLWKERTTVLVHAVNDWTAEQNISYDRYYHIWDALASAFAGVSFAMDDSYLAPLFDLDIE